MAADDDSLPTFPSSPLSPPQRPYGVGLLVAGYDSTGPRLFQTCPSGNYYEYFGMALGARSLANLEALVGQLYPAVIIARLVSLQALPTGN